MQRYLVVAFREGEPDRYCVLSDKCAIGRSPDSNLVLPDSTISRIHAIISIAGDVVLLEDNDSTNGVFVNGERIHRATLHEGDFTTLGAYTLVVRDYSVADAASLPKGKTLCIGYDTARKMHAESLEKRTPKHFSVLYSAALLLGTRPPISEFLQKVLLMASSCLQARHGAIVTRSGDMDRLHISARLALEGDLEDLPVSQTLVDHVLRTRTALLTENAQNDPRFASSASVIRRDIGAAMCVPLVGNRHCMGVLYLDARSDAGEFNESGLAFLAALSHIIGMAVENAQQDDLLARQERLAAIGQAIAGISHDVRSLLMMLKGGMEILESPEGRGEGDVLEERLGLMRRAVDRVESYMSNVLVFSKNIEIQRRPAGVNELVSEVLELVRKSAVEVGVSLVFRGGGFEAASIDSGQLHRVLLNLVKNAIDACGGNGGTVSVSVGRRSDALIIEVSDTGRGIPPEDIKRLAEPFFTSKGRAGMGLGLAVSYRIIEQHGGTIQVNSKPREGTVFTLFIPRSFETVRAPQAPDFDETQRVTVFKQCPCCAASWISQDRFLSDPEIVYCGYQVELDDLSLGLFLFNHTCGTTLAVPVGDFRHLYGGPIFEERLTGSAECPGYCVKKDETSLCSARCSCAYVREVMQIIQRWPKRAASA